MAGLQTGPRGLGTCCLFVPLAPSCAQLILSEYSLQHGVSSSISSEKVPLTQSQDRRKDSCEVQVSLGVPDGAFPMSLQALLVGAKPQAVEESHPELPAIPGLGAES